MTLTSALVRLVDSINDKLGQPRISPIDPKAPLGTQRRRIAAHNALLDTAKPFEDKICGQTAVLGPCVLKYGHAPSEYVDGERHMSAATREVALRYLVHSEPDPEQRA